MSEKTMLENIQGYTMKQVLKYIENDPEKNLSQLLNWADNYDKKGFFRSQREAFHNVLAHPEGKI